MSSTNVIISVIIIVLIVAGGAYTMGWFGQEEVVVEEVEPATVE